MVQQAYLGNPFIQFNLKYSINYFHPRHVTLFPFSTTILKPLCQFNAYLNREVQDPETLGSSKFHANKQQGKKRETVPLPHLERLQNNLPSSENLRSRTINSSAHETTCCMLPFLPSQPQLTVASQMQEGW